MSPSEGFAMVQGEQVLKRNARALIGWMAEQEAIAALLGRNPIAGEDVSELRSEISKGHSAVSLLPPFKVEDPLLVRSSPELEAVRERPEVNATFAGFNWRPAIVDLRSVLSFQKIIHVDGLEDRLRPAHDADGLLELCIPSVQPTPPAGAFTDLDGKGFTVSSFNPNLRIAGGQLNDANLSPGPGMPTVRMQAVTIFVHMGTSYLQVVRYRGRCFIRDGYHRSAGLLRQGIHEVPCIFIEAQSYDQVGAIQGAFTYETLFGERPPLLNEFWNDAVARDVTQVAVRKVVRIRGEEFVVPR